MLFPDLVRHPKTMQLHLMAIALGFAAILVGALVGFYRSASDPANVLTIQARELPK